MNGSEIKVKVKFEGTIIVKVPYELSNDNKNDLAKCVATGEAWACVECLKSLCCDSDEVLDEYAKQHELSRDVAAALYSVSEVLDINGVWTYIGIYPVGDEDRCSQD